MQGTHESLDRRHLELLIAIRHTGQLGFAAQTLSLSPSAASRRLHEAERRLGIDLTVAEGRTLRLTPAALHLTDVAEVAQTSLRSAEETARWMASAARPTVRLALDFYDTAPWFETLLGTDGTTDVDFVRVGYDESHDAIERRRADLGVVVGPTSTDEPGPDHLCSDELAAVVRCDHRAAARGELEPGDLRRATCLTAGNRPQDGFEHHRFFEPAGIRPDRLRKVESLAMILRLIRSFGGISVQPRLAVRDAPLDDLVVVPLQATAIAVRWRFVRRRDAGDDVDEVVAAIRRLVT